MKNWNWTNSILLLFVLLFACFVFTSYFIFFFQQRETFFFFFFFLHENEIDIACRKEHKEGGQGAVVTRFVNCEYRRGKSVARLRTTQGLKRVYYCKAADDEARNCAPERCIPLIPTHPPVPLISPSLSLAFYRQNCIFPWFSIAARPTRRARTRTSLRKSIDFSRIKEFPTCSLNLILSIFFQISIRVLDFFILSKMFQSMEHPVAYFHAHSQLRVVIRRIIRERTARFELMVF